MSSSWLTLAVCLACCWGASQLPDNLQRRLRVTLLDGCLPFQEAKSASRELWARQWRSDDDRIASLETQYQTERASWEAELRRRELTIAELNSRQQIRQQPEAAPFPIVASDALVEYDLVAATIVGPDQFRFLRRNFLIQSDELSDLERDALVVQAAEAAEVSESNGSLRVILDQGATTGFEREQTVFAGRCVVGALAEVGHFISRVRLLTDPEYRGRARILRQVEEGFAYGPEGILEGTGQPLCRLRYLSRTESVRVGDDVYTSGSVPMYYGRIVRAELDEHAPEWNVWIKPAVDLEQIRGVQVLRQTVNPVRRLAN